MLKQKRTVQQKLNGAWGRAVMFRESARDIQKERRRAAYHEAAHAVMCAMGGYAIEYVMLAEEYAGGLCKDIGRPDWHREEYTWMSLAGVAAEARFLRCGIFSIAPEIWDDDWESARAMIAGRLGKDDQEQWDDPEMDAAVDEAFANTKRQVAENWALIERVAHGLLERGRLEGDEVLYLCGLLCPVPTKTPA